MSLRKALFLGVIVTMGLAARAQDVPKVEVYGDYSLVHFDPSKRFTTSHDLNGGGGGIVFNFGKYFGIRGDFQGYGSRDERVHYSHKRHFARCPYESG